MTEMLGDEAKAAIDVGQSFRDFSQSKALAKERRWNTRDTPPMRGWEELRVT